MSGTSSRPAGRELFRRLRAVGPINALVTSLARSLGSAHSERVVSSLPRQGRVMVEVPAGRTITLWSQGDDWITSRLWWRGLGAYEPEVVPVFLALARRSRVVLDIGAHVGFYALLAGAVIEDDGQVFAFEANPTVADRLLRNVRLNPALPVTCVAAAVSESAGMAMFNLGDDGIAVSSSLSPAWAGRDVTIHVLTTSVDAFVDRAGIEHVDLVKIDVETAEPAVIAGMGAVIDRHRPAIVVEVGLGAPDAYAEMAAAMRAREYRFFHLTRQGLVAEDDLVEPAHYVDHDTTPINHLLLPAERATELLGYLT